MPEPSTTGPVAGAVFDLDGTLVDSEQRSQAAWSKLLRNHGVPVDQALLAKFIGRRGIEVITELLHLFPGKRPADLVDEAVSYAGDPTRPPPVPIPGAVELVTGLAQIGVPMAVATSAGRDYAHGVLSGLGLTTAFAAVVTADDVTTGKPDPQGFLLACRRLGIEPGAAIAFEDSPAGVAAAKAAGMTCVGVATTHPASALEAADLVVDDLRQVTPRQVADGRVRSG